jgi:spermidine synthase
MGTTYRSLLSWGIDTTAVELVPSVWQAFPFYHADARQVMADPHGRVVIDDGRRFLGRTRDRYDVIVVDPPPPIEAAGSSLLYSREFHEAVRDHLAPGGIFQTWFPARADENASAIALSLAAVFPHVKVFRSVEGWGFHFIASMDAIPDIDAADAVRRMPERARADLAEWQLHGVREDFATVLAQPLQLQVFLPARGIMLTDDRPVNEYYLLRRAARGDS